MDFNAEQDEESNGGYDPYVPKRSFASKIYSDVDKNVSKGEKSSKKKQEQEKQRKLEEERKKKEEEEARRAAEEDVDFLN